MKIRFRHPDIEREEKIQKRLRVLSVCFCFAFLIIFLRAIDLMLQDNQKLETIATAQYRAAIQSQTDRSRILDRGGKEMAISIPAWSLYGDPKAVDDVRLASLHLSKILNLPQRKIAEKLKSKRRFVWLARRLDSKKMEAIQKKQFKGIYLLKENMRLYPHGELASNVLGTVGVDSQGLAGLEMAYEPFLKITPPSDIYFRDAKGRLYQGAQVTETIPGKGDLYLTIDKNLQFFAEASLKQAVEQHGAKGGLLVMMDPKSGDILAMANHPTFNPNRFDQISQETWRNRAVTDIFEPGSIFKIIVAAAALEDKGLSPKEKFFCELGALTLAGGETIHDSHPYGWLTLKEVLQVSSNIGAYKIGKRVGRETFYNKIRAFGFGNKTGIDFPAESAGLVRPHKNWTPIDEGTLFFGHGIGVSALQIVGAFAAIANRGVILRPHLVEKIVGAEGEVLYHAQHQSLAEPILPKTAKLLTEILQSVVEEGGTAPLAAMEEYVVAGKTGTAQKVNPNGGGYLEGKYIASFIGFAPAQDPRLVTLVLLDEPQGSYYGGQVAAPVFKEVMGYSLHYLGVPPTKLLPVRVAGHPGAKPLNAKLMPYGNSFAVPDFRGASMRQILKATTQFPVEVVFKGSGEVITQKPEAGALVSAGGKIFVELSPLY